MLDAHVDERVVPASRATSRQRGVVNFVDAIRHDAKRLGSVILAALAPRPLGIDLGQAARERGGLALGRTAQRFHVLLQLFNLRFQPGNASISVGAAGTGGGIRDGLVGTHIDEDHIKGSSDFFHLEHAKKYQDAGRIKMNEMWVPAATITEDECEDEDRIIQAEARYRLKQKKGIRVFSRPNRLKDWLKANGLTLEEVSHLIVDAGQIVPTFTLISDGIEFFVHSPFATRMNETEVEDRNQDSIVVQTVFEVDGVKTKAILAADTRHECWTDIVILESVTHLGRSAVEKLK